MAGVPTGTVTFLFTDIEGSTKLWEEQPEAMRAALSRHDSLLRAAITANHGHIFKTVGDAFNAVFPTAPDALAAALAAQQALAGEPWPMPGGLRVRMTLHTGVAEERDGDYFGPTLNRAARLLAAAHGGQTLLFRTTYELLQEALPAGVTLRDLGQHRLRDLARPEQIFQLAAPGLAAEFPSLKSLDTLPNNLPVQLTSFIGREREIAEVKGLLATARLLTLTGSGGAGKTRLALQVAAELLEEFAEGVWLVEFGALSDPALVPQAVASSLGVREYTERPILTVLADFLQPRHVLLILDNCEHVVRDCAQVADHVLRACPDVRILVTSQEALGVSGEVTYSVPSLSLPDLRHLPSPEELKQYEAVRLFLERAVLSRPGFAVTADNAAAVAQAVHRLDGIPLAIELAAARTKVMSVQQIAERLNDRFRLLAAGGRTVAPRHQTLKAAMDWSYDLLEEQERTLLRRLAVFAGGWTLEAAEVVCAGEGIEGGHVLDLLARLVDRSLVLVQETAGGSTRYRLLETVREYGRDRLQEAGEEERTRTRHRDVYLQLAETAEPNLQGPEQSVWFDRLEAEHDNLGAALEWCKTAGDPEYWIRLAGALWRFWEVRGNWSEGRTWLEGALTQSAGLSTSGRVRVLNGAAYLAAFQGDYGRAATLAEEGLGLSRKLGDKRGTISCLNLMGLGACYLEKFDRAAELGKESLALSQESSDWWGMMDARIVLAFVARAQGDYGRASALLEESVAQIRQVGDKFRLAMGLNTLGLVKREQGDYEQATALLEETLALAQELGDKWGVAFAQSNLGIVAWYRGDYERAAALFAESLRLRADLGEKRGIVTSLVGLAAVAATQGEAEQAVLLFAAAEALREEISVPLPPFIRSNYEQYVTATRTGLGERRFAEAWAKGRTMALDEAIAYALGEASTRA